MKTHELKTWPSYFEAIINGTKTFEVRRNDRDFAPGDTLLLKEFDPGREAQGFFGTTGREITCGVGAVLHGGQFGIESGYCVMSIFYHPKLT
ncbi:MAG TPA: ASCH/PUA domain-containing protein [Bacteroidia bacterium]|nr:ASCH/PUA domain-containing protein [Bacteroidia bacterium]